VGKHIVVVSNLEHADLRGEKSEGMLLAAETNDVKTVRVVEAPKSKPGDQVYVEGIGTGKKTVKFDEFMKVSIYVQENKVLYKGSQLQTDKEKLVSEVKEGKVR